MRNIVKKLLVRILKSFTSVYLRLNKIEVIAITGSAGKTTTKVALSQFLDKNEVYVPTDNYNTEIGVPLAVFCEKTPTRIMSLISWLKIIFKIFHKMFKKASYKRIVLELSADHPGDIKYLTGFIKPSIGIVTAVFPVHTLEFKTIQNITREKGFLVEAIKKGGTAILNADDSNVRQMAKRTSEKVIFVGQDEKAEIRWKNIKFKEAGLSFDLYIRKQKYQVKTKIIAPHLIFALVSALTVGLILNMEIRSLINVLEKFEPEKGRMNVLKGKNNSLIIDDTYNGNPSSTSEALNVLEKMSGRKVAILGSMRELGSFEEQGHIDIITKAARVADEVYLVGDEMIKYSKLKLGKLNKKIVQKFENSRLAGEFIKDQIREDDVILIKGSQSVYMEEVTKALLVEPDKAPELLVRQGGMWDDKKSYMGEKI